MVGGFPFSACLPFLYFGVALRQFAQIISARFNRVRILGFLPWDREIADAQRQDKPDLRLDMAPRIYLLEAFQPCCWLRVSWGWGPSLWDWMCWMSWVILSSYSQTCASGSEEFYLHVLWFYDSSLLVIVISSAQNRWFFWNLLKVNVQISTDFTTFAAVELMELDTGWYWMTAKMGVIRVAMGVSGWCRLENLDHTPVSQNWTLDDPNGRSRGMDISTLPEAESTTWTLVFSHRLSKVRQSWQHPKHYHEVNLGRWRSKNLRPWFLGNIHEYSLSGLNVDICWCFLWDGGHCVHHSRSISVSPFDSFSHGARRGPGQRC